MTSLPGHFQCLRSRDVIFFRVTPSYCELRPCKEWNVQCTWVLGLLQPLPGDFRSNDVTSGSLPVTWRRESFLIAWLPPTASYGLVGSEMYSIREFSAFYSHFQIPVKWRPFLVTFVYLSFVTSFPAAWLLLQATAL